MAFTVGNRVRIIKRGCDSLTGTVMNGPLSDPGGGDYYKVHIDGCDPSSILDFQEYDLVGIQITDFADKDDIQNGKLLGAKTIEIKNTQHRNAREELEWKMHEYLGPLCDEVIEEFKKLGNHLKGNREIKPRIVSSTKTKNGTSFEVEFYEVLPKKL